MDNITFSTNFRVFGTWNEGYLLVYSLTRKYWYTSAWQATPMWRAICTLLTVRLFIVLDQKGGRAQTADVRLLIVFVLSSSCCDKRRQKSTEESIRSSFTSSIVTIRPEDTVDKKLGDWCVRNDYNFDCMYTWSRSCLIRRMDLWSVMAFLE